MSYMHIPNLYKDSRILLFKECYAMEKIHGTSAHITFTGDTPPMRYFSGGSSNAEFRALFDEDALVKAWTEMGIGPITVYGEAYGGKLQGMRDTYGDKLRFIAFEVKKDWWFGVGPAYRICKTLGIEFVPFAMISANLEEIDAERDAPSEVCKNILGKTMPREGVVLRPIFEAVIDGARVIAKHKSEKFSETRTSRRVGEKFDDESLAAREFADEWVTENRMGNILSSRQPEFLDIANTGEFIKVMLEDVERESGIEITGVTQKAIGRVAAKLFKKKISLGGGGEYEIKE